VGRFRPWSCHRGACIGMQPSRYRDPAAGGTSASPHYLPVAPNHRTARAVAAIHPADQFFRIRRFIFFALTVIGGYEMRTLSLLLPMALTLAACGPSVSTDTVESLVANPERLKELREQCRVERRKVSDELCARAAEATNRRFFGDGKTPYMPPKEAPKF